METPSWDLKTCDLPGLSLLKGSHIFQSEILVSIKYLKAYNYVWRMVWEDWAGILTQGGLC